MNKELEHVNDWFKANKLSLNATKTNYIFFSSNRKRFPKEAGIVSINNVPIPSTKFLGVYVDQSLKWNDHIEKISAKLARNIGIISRVAYLLPEHIRTSLYYSMIDPYLSYCNVIWASNYHFRLKGAICSSE